MNPVSKEYYLSKINSIEIAQEIIESLQDTKTKKRFLVFLESAKIDLDDFELLRERLSGYLSKLSEGN